MSRDRRGQWQRDRGGDGRRLSHPSQNPRGSRPRAEPGTFEIGDNIGWHRLQAPVQRESTFRGRLMELQFAVHLYGEVQAAHRVIKGMSVAAGLIELTCNQVTRGLMEIDEWLENLSAVLNSEIATYVMDLHHGDWA